MVRRGRNVVMNARHPYCAMSETDTIWRQRMAGTTLKEFGFFVAYHKHVHFIIILGLQVFPLHNYLRMRVDRGAITFIAGSVSATSRVAGGPRSSTPRRRRLAPVPPSALRRARDPRRPLYPPRARYPSHMTPLISLPFSDDRRDADRRLPT